MKPWQGYRKGVSGDLKMHQSQLQKGTIQRLKKPVIPESEA
jgi:hypothetical protein